MTDPRAHAALVPLCDQCLLERGLCSKHARHVLPQLAQPFWYQLVAFTHADGEKPTLDEFRGRLARMTPESKRSRRIATLVGGGFAPSRRNRKRAA